MRVYPDRRPWEGPGNYFAVLMRENFLATPAVLFHRALLRPGEDAFDGSPELRIGEDYDLWLRLAERTLFGVVPEPLVKIRSHENNMTSDVRKTTLSALAVYEKADRRSGGTLRRTRLWRQSIAMRYLFLGRRALLHGKIRDGVPDLLRAIAYDPWNGTHWKWLALAPWGRRICEKAWRMSNR